jgi:hypothetical protein
MQRLPRLRSTGAALALAASVALAGAAALAEARMELSSSSIVGGQIARPHACRGKGGSDQPLQLTIRGIPADAKFVSIVADDPDAMKPAGKVWVHWNVFNVPVHGGELAIAAGQQLAGEAGHTSGGGRGYEGMCPPDGVHTYRFAVFATRDKLQVDAGKPWTIDAFERQYASQFAGNAMITGRF